MIDFFNFFHRLQRNLASSTMANSNAKTNDTKPEPPQQFQFAQKPVERPGWEGFTHFLWNSETSEFLGRTGCSWCKYCPYLIILPPFLLHFFPPKILFLTWIDHNWLWIIQGVDEEEHIEPVFVLLFQRGEKWTLGLLLHILSKTFTSLDLQYLGLKTANLVLVELLLPLIFP